MNVDEVKRISLFNLFKNLSKILKVGTSILNCLKARISLFKLFKKLGESLSVDWSYTKVIGVVFWLKLKG